MDSAENRVDVIDHEGQILATLSGPKTEVAAGIFEVIQTQLIDTRS